MSNQLIRPATPLSIRLLCLFMAGLTGCSSTPRGWKETHVMNIAADSKTEVLEAWGAAPGEIGAPNPVIMPGFLLNLRSFADTKINGDFRVDFDGGLDLPYDISINTANTDLFQLKRKLATIYKPYFKSTPDVDVRVKEKRSWIDVRGLVEKPGRYLVEQNASLDSVIGMAGGASKTVPPEYVRIQKGEKTFGIDLNRYFRQGEDKPRILGWIGGEILFFQKEMARSVAQRSAAGSQLPIYMTGQVLHPGEYALHPDGDFLESLVQAGGFTDKADLDRIQIIRRTPRGKRVYEFSWNNLQAMPPPLPGDIVFVRADNITKAERRTGLLAGIIAAAATVVTAVVLVLTYQDNND